MIDINRATNAQLDAIALRPKWMAGAVTARDLQTKHFDPVRYVVPGIIPEGVTLLVGKPKLGKGWAALDLCNAVAGDRFTLGVIKPTQGDVIYLALEDNQRRLKRRMAKLLPDSDWPERLILQTEWRRANEGGLDDLSAWCESVTRPTLIVIDTLEKFRPQPKHGSQTYGTDYEAITGLQAMTKKHSGLCIVVVHHDRKMDADDPFDTVSGTQGLAGAADTIIVMKRKDGAVKMHIRGRDVEESDKPVQFNKATCRWSLMGDTLLEDRMSNERQSVLDAFESFTPAHDRDGMAVSEIMAATSREDRNAVDQLLFKMARDGELRRIRRGVYALPIGAGKKVSKKESVSQATGNIEDSESSRLLTDLTGPDPDGWSFQLDDQPTATAQL